MGSRNGRRPQPAKSAARLARAASVRPGRVNGAAQAADAPQAILRALRELTPDPQNANRGTERGRGLLEHSLRTYGAGRSLVVDRNGVVLAGNKTLEIAADIGLSEAIVVPTDGTKVVVVQRTDLDHADPRAKELALADNRVGQVSLDFDPAVLQQLAADGADLSKLWTEDELAALGAMVPDFQPVSEDEQGRLDQKSPVTCPACGHEFVPK